MATSPARGAASSRPAPRDAEQDTRQQVLSTLLTRGPQTAAQVAEELGLRAAGVRRHLDNLRYDGLVEKTDPPRVGSNPTAGRGRPAKAYRLTERGRAGFGDDYGSVAHRALELLDETAGRQAVCRLAEERIEEILAGVPRPSGESREELEETARAVARAFDRHGYAATVTFAKGGIQINQHHCPIARLAEAYPEMCEAEHEAISRRTGRRVLPLASIVAGHGVCTTHIPLEVLAPGSADP